MSAKHNLIDRVSGHLGVSRSEATAAVNAVIDAIADTLRDGSNVSISNFGTLRVVQLEDRLVRNPQNGELVEVPAKRVVRWKPSPTLGEYLNGGTDRTRLSVKAPKSS